jgi:MFS family permease
VIADYVYKARHFRRETWIALGTSGAAMGFLYGGISGVLFTLYLLRLGYGPEFVGTVIAVGQAAQALAALPAGLLAMRIGLRRILMLALTLVMLAGLAYAAAEWVPAAARQPYILAAAALLYSGTVVIGVCHVPLLASVTRAEERPHAFAILMCLSSLGAFLGSLVGGQLPGFFAGLTGLGLSHPRPYGLGLLAGNLAMAPLIWLVSRLPETRREQGARAAARSAMPPYEMLVVIGMMGLLRLAGESTTRSFYPVYLDQALAFSTAQIGLIVSLGSLLAVPAPLLLPQIVRRMGNLRAMVLGVLALSACIAGVALSGSGWMVGLAYVLMTPVAAVARSAWGLFSQEIVAPEWRPISSAANNLGIGVGTAALSAAGGYMVASLGYAPLFGMSAASVALGALTTWLYFGVLRRKAIPPA